MATAGAEVQDVLDVVTAAVAVFLEEQVGREKAEKEYARVMAGVEEIFEALGNEPTEDELWKATGMTLSVLFTNLSKVIAGLEEVSWHIRSKGGFFGALATVLKALVDGKVKGTSRKLSEMIMATADVCLYTLTGEGDSSKLTEAADEVMAAYGKENEGNEAVAAVFFAVVSHEPVLPESVYRVVAMLFERVNADMANRAFEDAASQEGTTGEA